MNTENKYEKLDALIESLELAYSAQFVPQSKSRNAKESSCLNWKITISSGNHPSQQLETDYMQGIGHLPNYSHRQGNIVWYHNQVLDTCENGKWNPRLTFENQQNTVLKKPLDRPLLRDVLYSLVMDSDAINYRNFEDWAENFGYDKDSRQAEKTYKVCLEIGLKLKSIIGWKKLDELKEAFEDY